MPDEDCAEYARRLIGARISELSAADVAELVESSLTSEILDAIAAALGKCSRRWARGYRRSNRDCHPHYIDRPQGVRKGPRTAAEPARYIRPAGCEKAAPRSGVHALPRVLTVSGARAEVDPMSDGPEDGAEDVRQGLEFLAEMQRNAVASIEANPWIPIFRLVRDEADRSGNRYLIEMFTALFKAYEASHYPPG